MTPSISDILGRLTDAQKLIVRSAEFCPPAAWIVDATGGRTGWERVAWKRNCERLREQGILEDRPLGGFYLTDGLGIEVQSALREGTRS